MRILFIGRQIFINRPRSRNHSRIMSPNISVTKLGSVIYERFLIVVTKQAQIYFSSAN